MDWRSGQDRRAWLENQGQNAVNALSYYLGPGVPVENILRVADMFNPVADIGRAGTAARGVVRPGASVSERVNALGNVATDMASVLAPVAGAAYADDAARGLVEGLANWSMPADDAVGRFVLDEDGAIRAWHGSPHDFDRFSMDKIGTGEGAQAYGHGLYFAENPGVAKSYQEALSNADAPLAVWKRPDGSEIDGFDVPGSVTLLRNNDVDVPFPILMERAEKEFARASSVRNPQLREAQTRKAQEALDWLRSNEGIGLSSHPERGRLYEVNIDANPEDFLDWGVPLSAQPESVKDALRAYLDPQYGRGFFDEYAAAGNGMSDIYRNFDDLTPQSMSRELAARGVQGTKYLDAGSRGAGDGSRNYVVFDDRLVDILGKDGARTTPQGKAQDVLDMLAAGRASEVTDDMLDLGDPVLNAQLNEYLWKNYDLPMDEASRMARAREMGLTFDTFHGSPVTGDIAAMSPSRSGEIGPGVYHTRSPAYANEYAVRYDAEGDPAGMGQVLPLRTVEPNMMKRREWVDQRGAEMDAIRAERGGEWSSDIPGLASDRMAAKTGGNVYYDGTARMDDQGVTLDPRNIRSRFARFDPRLAHLRNLSAGVGGLGIAVSQQSEQERSDDINDILAKYGVN